MFKPNYSMRNIYSLIASCLGLVTILGVVYQNNRLANMYLESKGKTRALFGFTELNQLDIKVYLGLTILIGIVFWVIAWRKREHKTGLIISSIFLCAATSSLFMRLWTYLV